VDSIESKAAHSQFEECPKTQSDDFVVGGVAGSPIGPRTNVKTSRHPVSDDCRLVYAKIPASTKEEQWGVFTMVPRQKGTAVNRFGDIVIQWPDPPTTLLHHPSSCREEDDDDCPSRHGLLQYTWNGQETGGHDEGRQWVESVVTGLGMCARSTTKKVSPHNMLPLVPRVDEGGLTRFDSPGVGAITQYHNFTWWLSKDVQAGEELVYYGVGKKLFHINACDNLEANVAFSPSGHSLADLKEFGYCIDNLRSRKSRLKEAGRGAFATRLLEEGTVVAPVPVTPITREELMGNDSNRNPKEQLLINYCLGSNSSKWLLFPFSPAVNLINHFHEPNVNLQWSSESLVKIQQQGYVLDADKTLHLELVATKEIREGDEIYLNYGRDWEDAWWNHATNIWKPINQHYTPSYVLDDAIRMLRTEQEQKEYPYPSNVFTSCFYRYSDRTVDERARAKRTNKRDSSTLTSYRWQLTKGLYDLKNLRPCSVLKRLEDAKGRSVYAVRILNRPGLDDYELIPNDELHIVTHIPRAAIRFSDRAGTTDQHLPDAFRHEIEFPGMHILEGHYDC
jgi:hypothetical protein